MTTETKTAKQLAKEELVEAVMFRLGDGVKLKKWQVEHTVNATIDVICDALADRRSVRFLHRLALIPKLRKGRKQKLPQSDGTMAEIETSDRWWIKVTVGDWLQACINRGKKPSQWSSFSTLGK